MAVVNKQATIWNPNDPNSKKVINVGDQMPTGFSLWTGGTATGQQAQAAIKKTSAPVTPVSNNIDSNTFQAGLQSNPQLPNSNDIASGLYVDRSLEDATKQQTSLQSELDKLKAQRITDTSAALKAEQDNLKNIQSQKDTQVQDYDTQFNPLKDKAVGIYDSMLDSIKDTNYSELTKQKLELTNDIVAYSKMFREELDAAASQGGLSSISAGRQNAVKENYTSKIAIAQAAQSAIDGNFNLAFDIMDRGATAIERLTNDRINFINTVQTLFSTKENTALANVLRLTTEEKTGLDNAVLDAQKKLDNLQKNKETIMELMKTNPIIANKAGLSLTDTPEQITKKLNKFYVSNPQYTPQNQEFIKKAMEKYIDVNISMNDPIETVRSKISLSKIYQKETKTTGSGGGGGTTPTGGITKTDISAIEANLLAVVGEDGFVSPDDYALAKQDWIALGGAPAEFDSKFKNRRNPNDNYDLTTADSVSPTDEGIIQQYKDEGYDKDEIIKAGFDKDSVENVFKKDSNIVGGVVGKVIDWLSFWK